MSTLNGTLGLLASWAEVEAARVAFVLLFGPKPKRDILADRLRSRVRGAAVTWPLKVTGPNVLAEALNPEVKSLVCVVFCDETRGFAAVLAEASRRLDAQEVACVEAGRLTTWADDPGSTTEELQEMLFGQADKPAIDSDEDRPPVTPRPASETPASVWESWDEAGSRGQAATELSPRPPTESNPAPEPAHVDEPGELGATAEPELDLVELALKAPEEEVRALIARMTPEQKQEYSRRLDAEFEEEAEQIHEPIAAVQADEDERLAIQHEPALADEPPLPESDDGSARRLVVTRASEIQPRAVRYLWDGRLPLGMIVLIGGREGEGKSTVAYERAARVTRGQLEGDLFGQPKGVIVVAAEDSWEHVIVPRLKAAGADLSRVYRVNVQLADLGLFELSLPEDLPELEDMIRKLDVALVVLDPLISRLNRKIDSHKDSEVRLALEPLAAVADRTGATFIGIIHVNKSGSTDPLTALMGSRAFAAAARAVLVVVRDGDTRLLCSAKNNLGPEQPSMSFRIDGVTVGTDPEDSRPITTAAVVWTGASERTARDVLEDQARGRMKSSRDGAAAWLTKRLSGGPVPSGDLKAEAESHGFSKRTLERAARDLGVQMTIAGFPKTSTWALPEGDL